MRRICVLLGLCIRVGGRLGVAIVAVLRLRAVSSMRGISSVIRALVWRGLAILTAVWAGICPRNTVMVMIACMSIWRWL